MASSSLLWVSDERNHTEYRPNMVTLLCPSRGPQLCSTEPVLLQNLLAGGTLFHFEFSSEV